MAILRLVCHPDFREEIEGDFWEKYHADVQKYGPQAARRRCYVQLLSLIRPHLIFNLSQYPMKSILNVKESPYGLLFLTALIMLAAVAAAPAASIDFQDKMMFSIPLSTMIWIIPLLLTCFGMLYFLTRKLLYSVVITWVHVLITVITTLLIAVVTYVGIAPSADISGQHELIGNVIYVLTLLFIFGQLVYLTNVLLGVFANRGRQ